MTRLPPSEHGFTIVEALVALAFVSVITAALSSLLVVALRSAGDARVETTALLLAMEKMEQLKSLVASPAPLSFSPGGSLDEDNPGFFDLADAEGRPVTGSAASLAAFSRRWSIRGLPFGIIPRVVLDVRVIDIQAREVVLTTVVARR